MCKRAGGGVRVLVSDGWMDSELASELAAASMPACNT